MLKLQWFKNRQQRRRRRIIARLARGRILDIGCDHRPSQLRLRATCCYVRTNATKTAAIPDEAKPHVFGDATALPFPDGVFDTVLLVKTLEQLSDPQTAVREAKRVLAPNGRLILSMPFPCPAVDVATDYRCWAQHGLYVLDTRARA